MRVEGAGSPLFVAEQDDLLAQELFLPRKVAQFLRRADRLPVAAHQLAHRAARLDAGQLVIGRQALPPVRRFHCVPPTPAGRRGFARKGAARATLTAGPSIFNSTQRPTLLSL